MLSQKMIKQNNIHKVFSLILEQSPISRIRLSEMTGLSKTTISALVDELIEKKYVVDIGVIDTGKQGRKPSNLRVNSDDNVLAVINWRTDELDLSLVDLGGTVVFRKSVPMGQVLNYPQLIRQQYQEILKPQLEERRLLAFCLVVPSMLNPQNEEMTNSTLPIPDGKEVINGLKKEFADVPMALLNDTACLAYAELKLAELGFDTFHFINMMNGIGDVTLIHGDMLSGQDGMRSQIGHFSIDRHGVECSCGNVGCLENEIGETALDKRAIRLGIERELEIKKRHLTFAELGKLSEQGLPEARRMVEILAEDLGFALRNIETIVYTNRIIIGGRGYKLGNYYLRKLESALKHNGFRSFVEQIEVQFTKLEEDAIYRGAALYFLNNYYDFCEPLSNLMIIG